MRAAYKGKGIPFLESLVRFEYVNRGRRSRLETKLDAERVLNRKKTNFFEIDNLIF